MSFRGFGFKSKEKAVFKSYKIAKGCYEYIHEYVTYLYGFLVVCLRLPFVCESQENSYFPLPILHSLERKTGHTVIGIFMPSLY